MRILVNLENTDEFREIHVEENEPLVNLKYIIEAEFSIPFSEQDLKYENKRLLNDQLMFKEYKIKEDEIIVLTRKNIPNNFNNANNQISSLNNTGLNITNHNSLTSIFDNTMKMLKSNPASNSNRSSEFLLESKVQSQSKYLKDYYINKPDELNMLFNTDSEMAEVIVSEDDKKLSDLIRRRITKYEDKKRKESDEYTKLMNADPNDKEAQLKIEEMIRRKNIDENLKMAEEYLPETFLQVHMLFINIEINKLNVVALVDTGAQTTIISEDLAKKCGVFNLCDTRYSGIAKGVGTSKIIGVIHAVQMKIGGK
jgi:DNA damage-inducible protein 1